MLALKKVSYSYNRGKKAVDDFSLVVKGGEFVSLLGPSGCGKTTLLRLISGFLTPDSGAVLIDGRDQLGLSPGMRRIGMVFQDYALFPHLSVFRNVMYPLECRKGDMSAQERNEVVADACRKLSISGLAERYPHELSGGQQQRVALARCLVQRPRLILMDEPLSSLDPGLRQSVREELKAIHDELKITTVYVTHDQEEAFCLSDNVAVMDCGSLMQYGTPEEIYYSPANEFVLNFTGGANILKTDGCDYAVRPEWISISDGENGLRATIESVSFFGARTRISALESDGNRIIADVPSVNARTLRTGDSVCFEVMHGVRI